MFGIDNLCQISAKATLEASKCPEFLILQTGLGHLLLVLLLDLLVLLLGPKFCFQDLSFASFAGILLEKGQMKAEEIWDIYRGAPRVAQLRS